MQMTEGNISNKNNYKLYTPWNKVGILCDVEVFFDGGT